MLLKYFIHPSLENLGESPLEQSESQAELLRAIPVVKIFLLTVTLL